MSGLERSGGCLCGAVRLKATLKGPGLQACHCVQCQQWTGGGPLVVADVTALEFEDETAVSRYHASSWGERLFCSICGSTVCWKMQGKPPNSVAVGVLDDQSGLTMAEEIFVDHRPGWLPIWPEASQSTEAQEFEKLRAAIGEDAP